MSAIKLKVTTNALPSSRIAVEIEIPADRCKTSYEDALSRLSRTVNLPGFRKGKVPKVVILQQLGTARIQASALEKLLQKSWEEALDQESIDPLCEPELKDGFENLLENFHPEKSLKIILETDIAPTPILKNSSGLKAEAEKVEYDPQRVNELIEQSRKQMATVVPVQERPAEIGDIAVLDFKGNYEDDGSDIEGGSGDSMDIELENGKMIPGFIEGIIGMSIDEKKSLKCEFPHDYQQESSRGRKAIFNVVLKDLKTRELPELDDSFAQQTSDKKNMVELKKDLEKKLKDEAERNQIKKRQESLVNALVKELEVELPKTLIELEVRNIIEQTARNFAQQGIDVKSIFTPDLVKSLMESSRAEAEDNLRRKMALSALSEKENIEVPEIEIKQKLKEVTAELSKEKNIDPEKLKQAVADDLLQEKLLKWLEENNTVIETTPEKETQSTKKKTSNKKSKDDSKTSKSTTKSNKSSSKA